MIHDSHAFGLRDSLEVVIPNVGLVFTAVVVVIIALYKIRKLKRIESFVFWVRIGYNRLSLRAKLKQALTCERRAPRPHIHLARPCLLVRLRGSLTPLVARADYQIATRIEDVYSVTMPEEVAALLRQISLRINLQVCRLRMTSSPPAPPPTS